MGVSIRSSQRLPKIIEYPLQPSEVFCDKPSLIVTTATRAFRPRRHLLLSGHCLWYGCALLQPLHTDLQRAPPARDVSAQALTNEPRSRESNGRVAFRIASLQACRLARGLQCANKGKPRCSRSCANDSYRLLHPVSGFLILTYSCFKKCSYFQNLVLGQNQLRLPPVSSELFFGSAGVGGVWGGLSL